MTDELKEINRFLRDLDREVNELDEYLNISEGIYETED